MKDPSAAWDYIEQRLDIIRGGDVQAPRPYAVAKPKGVNINAYYGGFIPPRRTEDTELLSQAITTKQEYLKRVEKHVRLRRLTHEFVRDWGMLNYLHGIITLAASAKDDDYQQARAGKDKKQRDKWLWLAHTITNAYAETKNRNKAEKRVVGLLEKIRDGKLVCPDPAFDAKWFANLISDDLGGLKSQYGEQKFSLKKMKALMAKHKKLPIPPVDLSAYKKPSP